MADLTSPFLIKLKGWLFRCIGIIASSLLFAEARSIKVALLLGLAIWAFCRFYYFAYYVIEPMNTDPRATSARKLCAAY